MNTEYCIKCGGKAEFSVSKPKFCPTCGSPFNRAASSVSKASFNEDEEEYEDDASEYVDVQSLKRKNIFKAEVNKDFKVTIADLAPPSPESSKASRQSQRGEESLSGEEIIRKMQMECSRIKTSTTIGE